MDASLFEFDLPTELIAQRPAEERESARLLVYSGSLPPEDTVVRCLPGALQPGDLLVFNDTRVIPARVHATRPTGGRVELLFQEPAAPRSSAGLESGQRAVGAAWTAMVRPAKKLRPGEELTSTADPRVRFRALERVGDSATWVIGLGEGDARDRALEILERVGQIPLPPYIERAPDASDAERYQTVYAKNGGAIAAPTAGLHFTDDLLAKVEQAGAERASLTLHVGAGTFLPVTADSLEGHTMHSERFHLPAATIAQIRTCKERGGRVIAVGTTCVRVLETCAGVIEGGAAPNDVEGETDIFLFPGQGPRLIDGLLTNFHLPKSTLLMLVASFIGTQETLDLYRHAVEQRYRFYSYGDATLLLPGTRRT